MALPTLAVTPGTGATVNTLPPGGQATGGNSLPVVIASDQSAIAVTSVPSLTASTNILTNTRVVAAATTNAVNLKAAVGNIGRVELFNNAAYTVFVKIYNKATAPTVGTDTPTWTIPIAPGSGYSASLSLGYYLSAGISYAITKLQADSDTTVLAAGDVTGFIGWI